MSDNSTPNNTAPVAESAPAPAESNDTSEVVESSEEGDAIAESSEAKPAAEAKKEEAKIAKKIKQLKLKVDGKEVLEDLPFEIDEDNKAVLEYMTKQAQMSKAAQKRMAESAEYKKQLDRVGEYLQAAKGNPKKIRELVKDLGVNEKELAAMIVEEEIENQKKTPAELEKEALLRELQDLKDKNERDKKDSESKEYERLVANEAERYNSMFEKALSTSGLPKTEYTVKRIADYMLLANSKGYDVSADDVIPLIKEEMQSDIRKLFDSSPEDFIEELLGKENLGRLRKRNLAKAKQAPPPPINKNIVDSGSKAPSKEEAKAKESFRDYFKKL